MYEHEDLYPDIDYFIFRECTPSWIMDEQVTDCVNITYVTKGTAQYTINNISYGVAAGDLLCLPSGTVRAAATPEDNLMVCYSVDFKLFNINRDQVSLPFPILYHAGLRGDVVNLFAELTYTLISKDLGYKIRARGLFLLILHRFFELAIYKADSPVRDPRIHKAIRYISENYGRNISTKKLAGFARLNPVYFGALFKREMGVPVNKYLVRIRMNHAENMLKSGEYTINETAERCGYGDVLYFRKQFKQVMGYPPSQCFNIV